MKKVLSMIFATSAAAIGLFFAGSAYASASTVVTVKSGDTVWGISQQYNSSVKAIESANNLQDANVIQVGQQLTIPSADTASNTQGSAHAATATTQQTQSYSQPAQTQTNQAQTSQASTSTSTATSGSVAEQAAQLMEQKTGVSASTWMAISYRESRNNPTAQNPSSTAHGLYQSLYTTSNDWREQVNDAARIYHSQGMGAWALN
ncbi:LysM peptidoglycan-binding domain-containing protein [Lentilactobacillus buchneri]|uniref:Peptidoglycan-binding protein n=2 Tax=Lentilactobacillus buchneri TaxID=1581 RepID=J9W5V3_LENBU|nr:MULTISPECIES: LysM peptidoglycan-binding domain-containing protein [Lentilactobacillus]MCC6101326.1 LysM peptidoglycan-binding domain-containing protein [Lactobacillus sp.]AEB72774.1 Peptidoglycan-binding lysin domain protein [Lentilactobacillus buchneri NRRL B-30929]AFR99640.1 peptidoglycan-binding protein [Lentilactobacillus buchneri subsp. silagei CD034]MCT2882074.1 LysM peptidoglycan-binding domain-containing protein [Lentilactobacillus buchneri]MCT2898968.1 LysM peptidoglycan-binding d